MANEERIREELRKAEEDFAATRSAIGIDRRFRPVSTVYNPVSGHIVASVERATQRIFSRKDFSSDSLESGRIRKLDRPVLRYITITSSRV